MLKFDPATQTSEVSLLKDIVSSEALNKFSQKNLNEVKSVTFSYKGLKDGLFKNTGMNINQSTKNAGKTISDFYGTENSKAYGK